MQSGLAGYAPALARIYADRPFGGVLVIPFARIHAVAAEVSARMPRRIVNCDGARRYDEVVVTRGLAGY